MEVTHTPVTRGWWTAQVSALGSHGAPSHREQSGTQTPHRGRPLRMNSPQRSGHTRVCDEGAPRRPGSRLGEDGLEGHGGCVRARGGGDKILALHFKARMTYTKSEPLENCSGPEPPSRAGRARRPPPAAGPLRTRTKRGLRRQQQHPLSQPRRRVRASASGETFVSPAP